MSSRLIVSESFETFLRHLRSPVVWFIYTGLLAYLVLVFTSAEYVQNMGASGLARNSPYVVYIMSASQAFWLYFAWAWMFSSSVTRDRAAQLQEVVFALPVSLSGLMAGRFLGTLGAAALLGTAGPLGTLIVHPMAAIGLLPESVVGPIAWGVMAHAWLLIVVPSAIGAGALYQWAAFRTRSAAGPFVVAGVLSALWMIAMVVLRAGDVDVVVASVLDPTGYAELEEQLDAWTPAQKASSYLTLTLPLLANRVLWGLLPVGGLAMSLAGLDREDLLVGTARARPHPSETRRVSMAGGPTPERPVRSAWLTATALEAGWQLRQSVGSRGALMLFGFMFLSTFASVFVHVVGHVEGPLHPRPELLTGLLLRSSFVVTLFLIAGFVGGVVRRDERPGFDEMVAATVAPLPVRVMGRFAAATVLTLMFVSIPMGAGLLATAVSIPEALSVATPLRHALVAYAPAMLEMCVIAFVIHVAIRHAGTAYALSMLAAFVLVSNEDIGVVEYPPALVGIPTDLALSELVGWAPFWELLAGLGVVKAAVVAAGIAVAWILWRRGTDLSVATRVAVAMRRAVGGAGALLVSAAVGLLIAGWFAHRQLVTVGIWESADDARANAARWEAAWIGQATPFEVSGGHVDWVLSPDDRAVTATWTLEGVRSPGDTLAMELPPGIHRVRATVQGAPAPWQSSHDHGAVELGDCGQSETGCTVVLSVEAQLRGWPVEGRTPFIHPSQAWIRSTDVLPRLGTDPERVLRDPRAREAHGLPAEVPGIVPAASVSAQGVAPVATWSYTWNVPAGWTVGGPGQIMGPLDVALAWRPHEAPHTEVDGIVAWHGASHEHAARDILDDVSTMQQCVRTALGSATPPISEVLQAPRRHEMGVHDGVLWLPEDRGWDVSGNGLGRWLRRYDVARHVAAATLVARAALRREPGSRWLTDGVAGWVGLSCVLSHDGDTAWRAVMGRKADGVVQALALLDAPIRGLSVDADAPWVRRYAPLATSSWAASEASVPGILDAVLGRVRGGEPLRSALRAEVGAEVADTLLGGPLASDARLTQSGDAGALRAQGDRFEWVEGGWTPVGPAEQLVVFGAGQHRSVRPTEILDGSGERTVLDAWPSFERAIDDNVWPPAP
ncbi:MAG: hypothetical protein AAGA48_23920 [Myxococcota bacterium]